MARVALGNDWASLWAASLGRACFQGSLCILLVWAICKVAGTRLPASLKSWLWWLACLKLTATLLCVTPPTLPILPAPPALQSQISPLPPILGESEQTQTHPFRFPQNWGRGGHSAFRGVEAGKQSFVSPSPLLLLGTLWLLGVALTIGTSVRQWWKLHRKIRRLLHGAAPRIVETNAVHGPLVTGLFRPVILLPQTTLSAEEHAMALAHETAHIRRGDLWLGLLPALTQALFFFFPLTHWAVREYHGACEEACDAAVLHGTQVAPVEYARLLLRFVSPQDPAPARGLGSGYAALRKRLLLLPGPIMTLSPRVRSLATLGLICALPGVLPWRLTTPPSSIHQRRLPDPRTLHFVLTDLGAADQSRTDATGLNAQGQVVGCVETDPPSVYGQAFVWGQSRTQTLPALPGNTYCRANGINDQGQIVASSYNTYDHDQAFLWQNGHRTTLTGLVNFPHSKALGINNQGLVVGYAQTGNYDSQRELIAHAVLWNMGGRPMDIGTLGGDYSAAYGVNDQGEIVGKADTSDFGSTHAFLWQKGRMMDLGTLGGSNSLALQVSDSGQAVGYSETGDTTHAFIWQDGAMRDLGTLSGGTESEAHAVNDQGQIVGTSDNTATLWQADRVVNLNHLVRNAPGWTLQNAVAVNAHGQIAGQGLAPDGHLHAFLLTPTGKS
jgi:probable HAF family extracellular repeat protein